MAVKECLPCRNLAACVALVTTFVAFPNRLWDIVNIPILMASHDNFVASVVVKDSPLWSVCSETAGGLYNPVSVKGSQITGATTVNSTARVVIVCVFGTTNHTVYANRTQFCLILFQCSLPFSLLGSERKL